MSWSSDTGLTSSWDAVPNHAPTVTFGGGTTLTYTWPTYAYLTLGVPLGLDSYALSDIFDPYIFQSITGAGFASSSTGTSWQGNISEIHPQLGYKVKPFSGNNYPVSLELTGIPDHNRYIPTYSYSGHNQLVSFAGCELTDVQLDINTVFPSWTGGMFQTIITDSLGAAWNTGQGKWLGSLVTLSPTKGYWLKASASAIPPNLTFQWNIPDFQGDEAIEGLILEPSFGSTFVDDTIGETAQNWSGELKHGSAGFSNGDTTIASGWSAEVGSPINGWTTLAPFDENFVEQEIYTNSFGSEAPPTEGFDHDPYAVVKIVIKGFFHTYDHPVETNDYFHTSDKDFTDKSDKWKWETTG